MKTWARGIILKCCVHVVEIPAKLFLSKHIKRTAHLKETWSISFNSLGIRKTLLNDDTLILLNQYQGLFSIEMSLSSE